MWAQFSSNSPDETSAQIDQRVAGRPGRDGGQTGGGLNTSTETASCDSPVASLPPLREIVARYGIVAHKRLGQNFLLDLNLTGRIARAAGRLDQATVIEIGPGPGGLTRALLASGARKIVAIERDRRCLAALDELAVA